MRRKIARVGLMVLGSVVILIIGLMVYVNLVAGATPPAHLPVSIGERKEVSPDFYLLGSNWLHHSRTGLYEMYLEGGPYERGLAGGKLARELVQHQEEVFTTQIHRLVPSTFYLGLLRYFVGWFNRDLDESVPEEFKLEIAGISEAASHRFDDIAPPYQRILNYHAAHDIGHALQNMSLVGCTAFAAWGKRTADSSLLVARNFDFYVGDEFARDKIVAFYRPSDGHPFMMVTWGGMTGVLSGMNLEGITVTINAAKSEIPSGSATPVSIVAREILQYASTIDEALKIARSRNMFVSESFLIGSARDHRAAIIEKSPEATVLYDPGGDKIVATNHFQSSTLGNTELNKEHMRTSASLYRMHRVEELMERESTLSVASAAGILRDQRGLLDSNIGLGNEKSINQLIAHHGIIFQPEKHLVWVSTAPWQLGKMVCYDLNKVFSGKFPVGQELTEQNKEIPADTFLSDPRFLPYLKFAKYRFPFQSRDNLQPDSLVKWNPDGYLAYMLAGDFCLERGEVDKAAGFYKTALKHEVASEQERQHMVRNLEKCKR